MSLEIIMALQKQAKTINKHQVKAVVDYLNTTRNPHRNKLMFYLSLYAGLRAIEIAKLTWAMVLRSDGSLDDYIRLTNIASKGKTGGRIIPVHRKLCICIAEWLTELGGNPSPDAFIITTERGNQTTAQVITNFFHHTYKKLGYEGCSGHSGRRTFADNVLRKIGEVGGTIVEVKELMGHSSVATTQRYITYNKKSADAVMKLI